MPITRSEETRMDGQLAQMLAIIQSMKQEIGEKIDEQGQRMKEHVQKMEEQGLKLENKLEEQAIAMKQEVEETLQEYKTEIKEAVNKEINQVKDFYNDLRQEIDQIKRQNFEKMDTPLLRPVDKITKMRPPEFDGKVAWSIYLRQFEAASQVNGWSDSDKATALIVALRGEALDILQGIPATEQSCYSALTQHLEMRYGDKHLQQVYQLQLKGRRQHSGEDLQHFEADVARLVRLAYPSAPTEFLNQLSVQVFVDGLRDCETQQALRLGRHTTVNDAVSCAGV